MLIKSKATKDSTNHLYQIDLRPSDVKFFGRPGSTVGSRTLLGVEGNFDVDSNGFVEFETDQVTFLNLGSGADVYLVTLGGESPEASLQSNTVAKSYHNKLQSNDAQFLAACVAEELPKRLQATARSLLEAIRGFSDDVLIEGQHRKWYTKPKNFIAITIQNTKKRLCIHVKDSPVLDSLQEVEVHRDARYVRLFLENEKQLNDIIRAVRASYDR